MRLVPLKKSIEHWKPEFRLLLACCHFTPSEAEIQHVRLLSEKMDNWETFLALVNRHGVCPVVHRSLCRNAREHVPESVIQTLHTQFLSNMIYTVNLGAEMTRLSKSLQGHGVPAIGFKGAPLSLRLYGQVFWRCFEDIDLLVPIGRMDDAEEILLANGYERIWPDVQLSSTQKAFVFKAYHAFTYLNRKRNVSVDLHWHLSSKPYSSFDEIHRKAIRRDVCTDFGSDQVPMLGDEETVLHLCEHGAKHAWSQLKWVCDLSEMLQRGQALCWERLYRMAAKSGLKRSLLQGLLLANDLLGAPLPMPLHDLARSHKAMPELVAYAVKALLESDEELEATGAMEAVRRIHYKLHLRRGLEYNWEALKRLLIDPSDFGRFSFVNSLFGL